MVAFSRENIGEAVSGNKKMEHQVSLGVDRQRAEGELELEGADQVHLQWRLAFCSRLPSTLVAMIFRTMADVLFLDPF
jgi:hypothetical protein